ncbi:hypothetical protein AcW1_002386 [Taiwanofungus camphoratus]|nr:hypothetical protein AcV7_003265 [Antrodia cinnamomea]KAI0944750.1 hypothetical protein AcW1_002386 [Antrodia cinnamomea]
MNPQRLPPELVEIVVQHAWLSTDPNNRWQFYRTISLVCQQWLGIISGIALRYPVFEHPSDVKVYCKLTSQWTARRTVGQDADSFARALFQRSHLRVDLTHRMHRFLHPDGWFAYDACVTIAHIVPDCKSMEVVVNFSPLLNTELSPYRALFNFLSKFRSMHSLYLYWPDIFIGRCPSPSIRLYTVTYLRIHQYPRCTCTPIHEQQCNSGECFHYYLPTLFPNLRHLHFDTPCILKRLTHPPSLQFVTLEAPPKHFLSTRGYFSSLMGWNIVSAVNAGFLKHEHEGLFERKIIVNTGSDEPDGWHQALAACQERDVALERRYMYPDTIAH